MNGTRCDLAEVGAGCGLGGGHCGRVLVKEGFDANLHRD